MLFVIDNIFYENGQGNLDQIHENYEHYEQVPVLKYAYHITMPGESGLNIFT